MAGTTLQDVIVPELFNPYVINRTMEISALVQCGIIANNTEFDALASQAAPTVNMPFFEDLTGESEQVIEGADLEDNKITSNKDVAAIIRRAKMWSATDLSAALAGSDPMAAIGSLVAGFWARDMQKELIALLEGVFGTISAGNENKPPAETRLASNLLDISGKSGAAANWSGSAFIDAEQMLGDAKAQLIFNTRFFGKVPNDDSGRVSLWNEVVSYVKQLAGLRAIEAVSTENIVVTRGENKRAVTVQLLVTPVNCMRQLYMTVVVE